jgi:hypothetical protein
VPASVQVETLPDEVRVDRTGVGVEPSTSTATPHELKSAEIISRKRMRKRLPCP